MNAEGYSDPTADEAIRKASKTPSEVSEIIKTLRAVAALAGYKIEDRIVLRDEDTGKIWR